MTQQKIKEFIEAVQFIADYGKNEDGFIQEKFKQFLDSTGEANDNSIELAHEHHRNLQIVENAEEFLTNLLDNWISVEDDLPPKIVDDFVETMTLDYIVICEHPNKEKRQTALASYDYETKEWTDYWCSVIKDVTHWIEPPKEE